MKAAFPSSAQAQNGSSEGSGETSIVRGTIYQLRCFPQEIDDVSDEISAHAEPRKQFFVFAQNLFRDEPNERFTLHPLA